MSYNRKQANSESFPLIVDGHVLHLTSDQVAQLIKKKMRGDRAVQKMFEKFEVSLDQLDNLNVEIADLEGRYAETDLESMTLDKSLFEDGRFLEDEWFVVVHELVHFLSRFREKNAYFADPEEVSGFVFSIASEMSNGSSMDEIWNKIYPRVSFHFNDENDARDFFMKSIKKAKQLLM